MLNATKPTVPNIMAKATRDASRLPLSTRVTARLATAIGRSGGEETGEPLRSQHVAHDRAPIHVPGKVPVSCGPVPVVRRGQRWSRIGDVVVVRGTRKFLRSVGRPLPGTPVGDGRLGDWYADVWFWRPQVAVFVNERSLLPVITPLAPARSVLERFPDQFARVARHIGVDPEGLENELESMNEHVLAKTSSRSVLGVLASFERQADAYRWRNDVIDLVELSSWLAQTPCGPLVSREGSPDRELLALLRPEGG